MPTATSSDIVEAVQSVVGQATRPVALHEPLFTGNERSYVLSCIDDGWVSSVGTFVDRFERDLAAYCGSLRAVAMVNGTCALQAALLALGLRPGDEVLVPALTFVATANAVVHAGGVPHFVEVEETSFGIDPQELRRHLESCAVLRDGVAVNQRTGRVIRALVPVHVFGHPCQLEALAALASEWGLQLLEDATEALGSTLGGKPVGHRETAVFSFNGNKVATTGGGGAVVTRDEALYRRLKHLSTTAKLPHAWAFLHDQIGFNFRMPNLNAALGCAQLEQMPTFVAAKRALAAAYEAAFSGLAGVRVLPSPPGTDSNYWLVSLLAQEDDERWLNGTLETLHAAQLQCRPAWQPLHMLPMYRDHPRSDLRLTESLARRVISLPSSVRLGLPFLSAERGRRDVPR